MLKLHKTTLESNLNNVFFVALLINLPFLRCMGIKPGLHSHGRVKYEDVS